MVESGWNTHKLPGDGSTWCRFGHRVTDVKLAHSCSCPILLSVMLFPQSISDKRHKVPCVISIPFSGPSVLKVALEFRVSRTKSSIIKQERSVKQLQTCLWKACNKGAKLFPSLNTTIRSPGWHDRLWQLQQTKFSLINLLFSAGGKILMFSVSSQGLLLRTEPWVLCLSCPTF